MPEWAWWVLGAPAGTITSLFALGVRALIKGQLVPRSALDDQREATRTAWAAHDAVWAQLMDVMLPSAALQRQVLTSLPMHQQQAAPAPAQGANP